ncbi:NlpC/P60 family protein [Paludibacterium yongneupense]|uniref:NlpC/P60 family protein n=1 Tax=Paludibacterium yongneupense TaxID=400061 RepID=UPI0004197494|nr:NlpC/P60 family protein [Paludibacterium yongneupense]
MTAPTLCTDRHDTAIPVRPRLVPYVRSRLPPAIRQHIEASLPSLSCGLLHIAEDGTTSFLPVRNGAADPMADCLIAAHEYERARATGTILYVVVTRHDGQPCPTEADREACDRDLVARLIISLPSEQVHTVVPRVDIPLFGRPYISEKYDCYGFVRDYYRMECGIEIPDYERHEFWWRNGQNLIMDNFQQAGFHAISGEPRRQDVLIIAINSEVANHVAIYCGDGLFAHQPSNKLSLCEPYSDEWKQKTLAVVRHEKFK